MESVPAEVGHVVDIDILHHLLQHGCQQIQFIPKPWIHTHIPVEGFGVGI